MLLMFVSCLQLLYGSIAPILSEKERNGTDNATGKFWGYVFWVSLFICYNKLVRYDEKGSMSDHRVEHLQLEGLIKPQESMGVSGSRRILCMRFAHCSTIDSPQPAWNQSGRSSRSSNRPETRARPGSAVGDRRPGSRYGKSNALVAVDCARFTDEWCGLCCEECEESIKSSMCCMDMKT